MNSSLKKTSQRYIIVPIAMLGIIAILTLRIPDKAEAFENSNKRDDFANVISKKFGLDRSKVAETINEFHDQQKNHTENRELHQQEMEARFEERLQRAVAENNLTETQRQAILEKHDEMRERLQELREQDYSREDLREMMADVHEEMQAWADEQGIDFDVFMKFGRR